MKHKIAVFANGWSDDIVCNALKGIRMCAQEKNSDVFLFLSYASYGNDREYNQGENGVFTLMRPEDYDGLIVLSNILNTDEDTVYSFCRSAIEHSLPVVSVGMELPGATLVKADNRVGMADLVRHVINDCGARRIAYVGGPADHVDCTYRLKVLKSVAAASNVVVNESDVYYGDWSFLEAMNLADRIIDSGTGLPDAIVCANDSTAIAVTVRFRQRGYDVPRNVLVTGFDCSMAGKSFFPALTTVEQDYKEIGYQCCRWIYDKLDRKTTPEDINVASKFVPGESTSVTNTEMPKYADIRRKIAQNAYTNAMEMILLEQSESNIDNIIMKSKSVEELKNGLRWRYRNSHEFEGNNFYLLVEDDFFESANERMEVQSVKINETRKVIVAMKDRVLLETDRIARRKLIPEYHKDENESHVYMVSPFHAKASNFGYIVMVDNFSFLEGKNMCGYSARIGTALERLRGNLYVNRLNEELTQLSLRDSLTGLGNRFSIIHKAIPLFEETHKRMEKMVVMFIDINNMKIINDRFGHLQGDLALRIVANVIKKTVSDDWLSIRYGGDEFLLVGTFSETLNPESIQTQIDREVENAMTEMAVPFELSVSCGYVLTNPEEKAELSDYIALADQKMYAVKQEFHKMHDK